MWTRRLHSSGHQIKRSLKRSSQTRVRLRCECDPTSIRPDCWKNCAFCGTKPGPVGHVDLQKRRRLCWVGRLVGIFPSCKFGPMEEQLTYCGGKYTPRSIWPTSDANVLLHHPATCAAAHWSVSPTHHPVQTRTISLAWKGSATTCQGFWVFFGPNEPNYGGESTPKISFHLFLKTERYLPPSSVCSMQTVSRGTSQLSLDSNQTD